MVVTILVLLTIVASIYESILLGKGYDLVERRRSSRVNKKDIDQTKKNGVTGTDNKHMEMYRIGQENNISGTNVKNGKQLKNDMNIERSTRTLNIFSRFLICFGLRGNLQSICNVDKSDPVSYFIRNEENYFERSSFDFIGFLNLCSWHATSLPAVDCYGSHILTIICCGRKSSEFSFVSLNNLSKIHDFNYSTVER